jgi:hypothetical protein
VRRWRWEQRAYLDASPWKEEGGAKRPALAAEAVQRSALYAVRRGSPLALWSMDGPDSGACLAPLPAIRPCFGFRVRSQIS